MHWIFMIILLFLNHFHHYGDCGVLNWNISVPKLSQDFDSDFNLEAALDNEMQSDLLKMAGTPKPSINFEIPSSETESTYPLNTMDDYYPTYTVAYDTYPNLNSEENIAKILNLNNDQINEKISENLRGYPIFDEVELSQNNNQQKYNSKEDRKKEKDNENSQVRHGNLYEDFVGTNLFGIDRKKCFSTEDVALLTARRDFESLLPKHWPKFLPNDRTIKILMNYFEICHQTIARMSTNVTKRLVEQVYYDTVGGYLNHYLVPLVKYSFYAGHISLRAVNSVIQLHKLSKNILNVNGNGWKQPIQNLETELREVKIKPLHIDEKTSCKGPSYCLRLNMDYQCSNDADYDNDHNGDSRKMLVPLPKLEAEDSEGSLGNIWLPFRCKCTYDLRADNSAYIIVKFYETVTRCYQYQHVNQDCFNEKFHTWIVENIQVHLSDEQFYPGLGAVLRINENLSEGKTGNLYGDNLMEQDFDYDEDGDLIQKRDKGSGGQTSSYHLKMRNFDDETNKFLDDISKTNLLNGITKKWLMDDIANVNANKNNTVAYNIYRNIGQQPSTKLDKFNSSINTINPISSNGLNKQLDAEQNENLESQKELKTKFEQMANQSIQSGLMQGSNKKPEMKNLKDFLPTDWKSPQAIALMSIPIALLILICFCCCCRSKQIITLTPQVKPITHVDHKVPVGVPIDSGSSIHSSSTDTFMERLPRAKKYVAKGPLVPETTSVSFTTSSPSKSPASKGKATPTPPPTPVKSKATPAPPPTPVKTKAAPTPATPAKTKATPPPPSPAKSKAAPPPPKGKAAAPAKKK